MKIRYTPRALADLQEIYFYLRKLSPSGADNVRTAIKNSVNAIGREPHRGQATDKHDIKRAPIIRYRYAVYFRVASDAVQIVHIRHTARELPGRNEL